MNCNNFITDFLVVLLALNCSAQIAYLATIGMNNDIIFDRMSPFLAAKERYKDRIIQYGYAPSREDYLNVLSRGAVVISTAQQENFGISIVEAVRFGCFPLLPARLAYPEIIPDHCHPHVLYHDQEALVTQLHRLINHCTDFQELRIRLANSMRRYAWNNVIDDYDRLLETLACIA